MLGWVAVNGRQWIGCYMTEDFNACIAEQASDSFKFRKFRLECTCDYVWIQITMPVWWATMKGLAWCGVKIRCQIAAQCRPVENMSPNHGHHYILLPRCLCHQQPSHPWCYRLALPPLQLCSSSFSWFYSSFVGGCSEDGKLWVSLLGNNVCISALFLFKQKQSTDANVLICDKLSLLYCTRHNQGCKKNVFLRFVVFQQFF